VADDTLLEHEELSKEALAALQDEVKEKVITARVGLLLRHPWFGNMATRLRVQPCDGWCPTAATDGRNLFYNSQFFNKLTTKQIEFVIAHEILHCVFDHIIRREERNPQLYNVACDYKVNNTLVRDKIGDVPDIQIYQDYKYDGWTSEEIYDELYDQADKIDLDELGKMLDEHVDWEKEQESNGSGKDKKDGDGKGGRPKYTREELEKIRDEIKENMISAAQGAGAGNVPGEIERMIKDLTEPKMNWREILQQQIQSTIKNDFTFARPSRKGWHMGAVLPGQNFDETIDICIALDMSGSIGDEQARVFLSEIKGIMDQYEDYRIKLWCFDTEVYNQDEFSADDGRKITDYDIKGGGGTDFDCNWNYMKEHDIQPKKFIMFTDGMPWSSWGDPDYCDTVFLIHSVYGRAPEAPFGVTTYYEDA
jgi:predicted metal-dependent peptidase